MLVGELATLDEYPNQDVFSPCTQRSWDRLQILQGSDQDQMVPEDAKRIRS